MGERVVRRSARRRWLLAGAVGVMLAVALPASAGVAATAPEVTVWSAPTRSGAVGYAPSGAYGLIASGLAPDGSRAAALYLVGTTLVSAQWRAGRWSTPLSLLGKTGPIEAPRQIVASMSSDLQTALVVWQTAAGVLRSTMLVHGSWSPAADLPGVGVATWLGGVAMSRDGSRAVATWTASPTATTTIGRAADWTAGAWSAPVDVTDPVLRDPAAGDRTITACAVRVSADGGTVLATWDLEEKSLTTGRYYAAQASWRRGGVWSPVGDMHVPGCGRLSLSATGTRALMQWSGGIVEDAWRIESSSWWNGATWVGSGFGAGADYPNVVDGSISAVSDDGGTAVSLWHTATVGLNDDGPPNRTWVGALVSGRLKVRQVPTGSAAVAWRPVALSVSADGSRATALLSSVHDGLTAVTWRPGASAIPAPVTVAEAPGLASLAATPDGRRALALWLTVTAPRPWVESVAMTTRTAPLRTRVTGWPSRPVVVRTGRAATKPVVVHLVADPARARRGALQHLVCGKPGAATRCRWKSVRAVGWPNWAAGSAAVALVARRGVTARYRVVLPATSTATWWTSPVLTLTGR